MSESIANTTGRLAREAAQRLCWAQWVGLGSLAAPADQRRAESIIGTEALILASLYLETGERRLSDLVGWWAHAGTHLTSLQRMKTLRKRFPGKAGERALRDFSALAVAAGHRRWKAAAVEGGAPETRPGKGPEEPALIESSALWPRLRAGFGVGAKADALVFLLGLRGAWASAQTIAFATGYSAVTIHKVVGEMAHARLIRATEGRPAEYLAPPRAWAELLELYPSPTRWDELPDAAPPAWRFWSEVLAFLIGAIEWSRLDPASGEHVLASKARDLVEQHRKALAFNAVPAPSMEHFRGKEASRGLLETVSAVAGWMDEAL